MNKSMEIGGGSHPLGIVFVSNNYEIEVKTFPRIEIGDVKLSKKGEKEDKRLRIIIPLIGGLLLFFEFMNKVPWYIFRPILFSIFLTIIIYTTYHYGFGSYGRMRANHGAEHKVILAYKTGKINDFNELSKVSRFTQWCGSVLIIPIFIILSLGDYIRFPFTFSLLYYFCYLYIDPIRNLLFKIIGKPIQFMTTQEPSREILEAAKIGLLRLIKQEESFRNEY